MSERTDGGFLGLTWGGMRASASTRAPGGFTRTTLVRSDEHMITSDSLRRGAASDIHGNGGSTVSIHVLDGEIVEERWTIDDEGAWKYASRRMRAGETAEVPRGAIHRIAAMRDATLLTTFTPPPPDVIEPVEPGILPMLRLARGGMLEASTTTSVELRAPAPETTGDEDA